MESARAEAARIRDEAEAERRRLDEESRARRVQIEEDFEIAMASRRTESMRVLARSEADARNRARTQLRDAAAEVARRRREADDEVAEVRRLRARVSNQLAALRESLAELPGLDAFPDEVSDETRPMRVAEPGQGATAPSARGDSDDPRDTDRRDTDRHETDRHDDGGRPTSDPAYGARSAAATSS
jgi:hypothetical protein